MTACLCLALNSAGCYYALPAITPPSQERVRVVATIPEVYSVHVDAGQSADYVVPSNGRVTLAIPGYRRGCRVYLLGSVKVSDGYDPLKDWLVTVTASKKTVRTLSLRQVTRLPTDPEGFRLLKIAD